MSLDAQGRGGSREGAGRPKKKKSELQKTHSIRATDKDWKEIQIAARIIKGCQLKSKRPRVFMLDEDEFLQVNQMLIEEINEKRHDARKQEAPAPIRQEPQKIEIVRPKSVSEEEAVSLFLEYYRMNPIDAVSGISAKLDKERRRKALEETRMRQEMVMDKLEEEADDTLQSIDEINRKVAEMLRFADAQWS